MASPDYLALDPGMFLANDSLEAALINNNRYGSAYAGRQARQRGLPAYEASVNNANSLMQQAHQQEQENELYKARLSATVGLQDVLAQPGTLGIGATVSNPQDIQSNLASLFNQGSQDTLEGALVQNAQRIAAGSGTGDGDDIYSQLEGFKFQVGDQSTGEFEYNLDDYARQDGDPAGISDPHIRRIYENFLAEHGGGASSTSANPNVDLSAAEANVARASPPGTMLRVNADGQMEVVEYGE